MRRATVIHPGRERIRVPGCREPVYRAALDAACHSIIVQRGGAPSHARRCTILRALHVAIDRMLITGRGNMVTLSIARVRKALHCLAPNCEALVPHMGGLSAALVLGEFIHRCVTTLQVDGREPVVIETGRGLSVTRDVARCVLNFIKQELEGSCNRQ